jgi:hypothetical protein
MLKRFIGLVALASAVAFAPPRNASATHDDKPQPFERSWQNGPAQLTLRLNNTSPLVADEVAAQLRVTVPVRTEVELPALKGLPKELQVSGVRTVGPTSDPGGGQVWELNFKIEVLGPGQFELPPLTVRFRDGTDGDWSSIESEPVSLEFRSMLGDDPESAQPRPNPNPLGFPAPWLGSLLIATALLLLVASAAFFLMKRRSPARVAALPTLSPYEKAMKAFERIEAAGYLDRGEVDRFYTELSSVVRYYIEDQFGLRAPEQTTEEFLQALAGRPGLIQSHQEALVSFLEQCDLVKFAKLRPTSREGKSVLDAARAFVENSYQLSAKIRPSAVSNQLSASQAAARALDGK